jgi:hypothetical protein
LRSIEIPGSVPFTDGSAFPDTHVKEEEKEAREVEKEVEEDVREEALNVQNRQTNGDFGQIEIDV